MQFNCVAYKNEFIDLSSTLRIFNIEEIYYIFF